MNKLIVIAIGLLVSSVSYADLIALKPVSPAASNTGIPLSAGATVTIDKSTYDLVSVGNGLRQKQVLGLANVYVGQLMINDSSRYVKTVAGALPSLQNEISVALVLNFLMYVPTFMVTSDFNGAVTKNKISTSDADIVAFMKIINTLSFNNGNQLTLFFTKEADGSQTLAVENKPSTGAAPVIAPIKLSSDGMHKVMSMFLGVPVDAQLAAFQTQLMQ